MDWKTAACVVLATTLLLTGCDEKQSAPEAPLSTRSVLGKGGIRGRVTFVGTPPEMKAIANQPCHDAAEAIKEEMIVVNDGALQNTLVFIAGGPRFSGAALEPSVLDQKSCRYVPHVLGVQVGQTLRIRSSDPTIHNVHYTPDRNPPGNFGMTAAGSEKDVKFLNADIFRVKCDVHPWMTAYVGVFDNPFFDVSDADGKFDIDQVPAGSYKLVAWHEQLGKIERDVVVADDQPLDVSFEYRAP